MSLLYCYLQNLIKIVRHIDRCVGVKFPGVIGFCEITNFEIDC